MHFRPDLCVLCLLLLTAPKAATAGLSWQRLATGVHYTKVDIAAKNPKIKVRDSNLHIVRVDPKRAELVPLVASALGQKHQTAAQWADQHRLVAAINLGMFLPDHKTHAGYLRTGGHINAKRWASKYLSLFGFGHKRRRFGPVSFAEHSRGPEPAAFQRHTTVVQNLRLIKRVGNKGVGVWSEQPKQWSEAAVAIDRRGRVLFLFARLPLSMATFNATVLALPLNIVHAMHMEGGPEASLSLRSNKVKLDLCGSFETKFLPDDSNVVQWPIPNVIGVRAR